MFDIIKIRLSILWHEIKMLYFRICLYFVRLYKAYWERKAEKLQSKINKNPQTKAVYERVEVKKKFKKRKNKGKR